jgi:hypothetical protein
MGLWGVLMRVTIRTVFPGQEDRNVTMPGTTGKILSGRSIEFSQGIPIGLVMRISKKIVGLIHPGYAMSATQKLLVSWKMFVLVWVSYGWAST